jgi:hypothetical protein
LELTSEGHYLIAGGYQGRAEIDKEQVTFSAWNVEISRAFTGKNIDAGETVTESAALAPIIVSLSDVELVLAAHGLGLV